MAPDRQSADAAAVAVGDMQGGVVQNAHDEVLQAESATSGERQKIEPEITRRDVHTASSISAQRRYPKAAAKEPNLAHQAALRRSSVKGKSIAHESTPDSSSTPSSKPVLVRAPSNKVDMRKKSKPRVDSGSPKMPPLESFSFADILASIGPEADASIEAIAEICGRSKMSLAEEHSSHRPPHGELQIVESSPAESVPSMRLEPVEERSSTGPHTRSKSRSLALANVSHSGDARSSNATAATSNITSHAQANSPRSRRRTNSATNAAPAPLISQIFAWLRRSDAGSDASNISDRDPRAARVLQSMLSDADSIRS